MLLIFLHLFIAFDHFNCENFISGFAIRVLIIEKNRANRY